MNKKSRKLITWCLVLCMVLTQMLFTNVALAATKNEGANRYETASNVAMTWGKADTAVLAFGEDYPDALAAAPLAAAYGAPILLTQTNTLDASTKLALTSLGVKNVIIVGGVNAVSKAVEDSLTGMTVTRIAGATRVATALAIAKAVDAKTGVTPTEVFLASSANYPDALSVSSEAAALKCPILLTDKDAVDADVAAYIGSKKVYVIGGTSAVSDAVLAKFAGAVRVAGADRYETNLAVLKAFAADFKLATIFLATGENYPDALAGSVLAAKTNSPIVLLGASISAATMDYLKTLVTKDSKVATLGSLSSVAAAATALENVINPTTPAGEVSVSSVKAVAANAFKVAFTAVPADTSKVVFTVQRETTPVTVTTSWNGTEATLTYSSNFPQGSYTVNVKNDATDLGTSNVTVEANKVSKIELTTDTFAVETSGTVGYFSYKVLDQYGNDVTDTNYSSINWTVPGATWQEASNEARGVIQATANTTGFSFLNLSSITLTGVDSTDNIVVSATLKVSAAVGTLTSIKLLDVTNADNKPLQVTGDASQKWYVNYEATDMGGNLTTNFALLKGGLIDQDAANHAGETDPITLSSSGYVTAQMVDNSGVGQIELTVVSDQANQLTTDVPVIINAITKNGVTSTLNLTLKHPSMPTTFTLMTPSSEVAYSDSVEIPFVCYDADGTQLTKFDDIAGSVIGSTSYYGAKSSISLSPMWDGLDSSSGLYFTKRGDGTAKLNFHAAVSTSTQSQTMTLSATTNSGKYSTVTLSVRPSGDAQTLTVNTDKMITRLAAGGAVDYDETYFTVKDQYGRAMTLAQNGQTDLYIKATVTSGSDNVTTSSVYTTLDTDISLMANSSDTLKNNGGTFTVKFSLMDGANAVASKSVDYTVVKDSNIAGIKMATAANNANIYTTYNLGGTATNAVWATNAYRCNFAVYAVDSNGNTVILPADQSNLKVTKSNNNLTTVGLLEAGASVNLDCVNLNYIALTSKEDADALSTIVTVTDLVGGNVRSASFTVNVSESEAVSTGIKVADEIDTTKYASTALLRDIVSVTDQYGKNMVRRADDSVSFYATKAGVTTQLIGAGNTLFSTLNTTYGLSGSVLTIVDNNGHSVSVTVK